MYSFIGDIYYVYIFYINQIKKYFNWNIIMMKKNIDLERRSVDERNSDHFQELQKILDAK